MCRKQTQLQDHQSAANVCLSSKILCIYIVFWIFFRWLLIQSWIFCDDKLVRKSVWSDLLHVASSESLHMPKTHTQRTSFEHWPTSPPRSKNSTFSQNWPNCPSTPMNSTFIVWTVPVPEPPDSLQCFIVVRHSAPSLMSSVYRLA